MFYNRKSKCLGVKEKTTKNAGYGMEIYSDKKEKLIA
jgi:hypothetical protein